MSHFSLRVTSSEKTRVIISVSKKVAKKAVTRNLIKRRIRPILNKFSLKPAQYLLIARPGSDKIKGEELQEELRALFKL